MRHDPASAAVVVMLRGLKMHGMAQAVGDLIEQGAPAFGAAVPMLSQLLKAEMAEREVRSISYQIKAARFPSYKDLTGFDFAASEINEALIRQLHRGDFMDGADNVVLIGGPGTGKSHIATALGEAAQGSACGARGMAAEGCRRSSISAKKSGSSPPSIWSMRSNRKRQ